MRGGSLWGTVLRERQEQAPTKVWVLEGQGDPTHAGVTKGVCQAWGSLKRGSRGTHCFAPS